MATSNIFGDPQVQALLGLSQGLLAAGSPQRFPVSTGGALAQGIGGALSGAMNAQNYNLAQQRVALTGLQAAHMQYQAQLQSWWLNGRKGPPPVPPSLPPAFGGQAAAPASASPVVPDQQSAAAAGPTAPPPAYGQPGFAPLPSGPQPAGDTLSQLPAYAQDAMSADLVFPGSGMGQVIMQANQPIGLRQGPLVSPTGKIIFQNTPPVPGVNFDYDPGGKVTGASEIPNFGATVAGIEAKKASAKAAAEASQRTVEVTTPDGRKVRVPESYITGGAQSAPAAPPAATPPAPVPAPVVVPPAAQGITPAMEEAQKANESALAAEASKGREAANLAVDTNYNLQHVLEASKGFDTGQFAPTVNGARAFLQGVAPGLFPDSEMKKLTSFQEFNKYSIRLGFDQARKMGARESTQIVQMAIESNPNPKMVKPAINAIANGLMAQNDYVIAKEKARDAYFTQNKKLGGFNSYWQSIADPRAFLLARQDPASQAKMISSLSPADRQKLTNSLTALRKAGIL